MAVRPLVHVGDPVLRTPTTPIAAHELGSAEVQGLIDDLIDTMHDAGGAGIAATQIGSSLRVAIAEVGPHTRARYPYKPLIPLTVLVNPTLEPLEEEGTEPIIEGCLSVPVIRGELPRWTAVRVRWLDRDGGEHDEVLRGVTAGTFQHEVERGPYAGQHILGGWRLHTRHDLAVDDQDRVGIGATDVDADPLHDAHCPSTVV